MLDYRSPTFGGFTGYAGYAFGEVAGNSKRGGNLSVGVSYASGPLYMAIAHEIHDQFYGGSRNIPTALRNITGGTGSTFVANPGTDSKDTSTRISTLYKFSDATRVEATFAVTKLSETGGTCLLYTSPSPRDS